MKRHAVFFSLLALTFCGALAESPYSKPVSRVTRNLDGTRLDLKVDPYSQRVEETLYDQGGGVIWRLVRELDEELQPVRATKTDGRNQIISSHKYVCLRGQVQEEEIFNAKGVLLARLAYYYDSQGRMVRIDHFNAKGALVSTSRSSGSGVEPLRKEIDGTNPRPTTP